MWEAEQEDPKFETSLSCKAKLSGTGKLALLVLLSRTLMYRHCRRKHGLEARKRSIGLLKGFNRKLPIYRENGHAIL